MSRLSLRIFCLESVEGPILIGPNEGICCVSEEKFIFGNGVDYLEKFGVNFWTD